MIRLGLLGEKLSHSYSKIIHEKHLAEVGILACYDLIECSKEELPKYLKMLRDGVYAGFNVTIPYKEIIIPLLDELSIEAKAINAVNTIVVHNGLLVGHNTDAYGFSYMLNFHNIALGSHIFVLGTGGASKAVCYALSKENKSYSIVSRNPKSNQISYQDMINTPIDCVINTTPVGMYPDCNNAILSKDLVKDATVIDLIFNPPQTKLMSYAKLAYNGLVMLIAQALKSESIWFNNVYEPKDEFIKEIEKLVYEESENE